MVAAIETGLHRATGAYRRHVSLFIAPSEYLASRLLDAGIRADAIRHVANGVSLPRESAPPPSGDRYFLFAGRLVPEKGVGVLTSAAALVPELKILVAGDGPLRATLEASAPPNVRFVGNQPAQEIARLLEGSVAAVVPSTWYENAPIAALEACAHGRAVIASSIGGLPEIIDETVGALVDPGDPLGLADALRLLWNDAPFAAALGAAARERAVQRYGLETHVDALEHVYEEALRAGVRPGRRAMHRPTVA